MKRTIAALSLFPLILFFSRGALASYGEHLDSVHFHSVSPDFGIPPRRAQAGEGDVRPPGQGQFSYGGSTDYAELSKERDDQQAINRRSLRTKAVAKARAAITERNWPVAQKALTAVVERFGDDGGLRDRAELLHHGIALRPYLGRYFDALSDLEAEPPDAARWQRADTVLSKLASDSAVPAVLREHATYQRACLLAQDNDFSHALSVWQAQLRQFPHGEKREAALIMVSRAALLHRGADIATGRAAAQQLLHSFPTTRFAAAAKGLLARAELLEGHCEPATRMYCQLGDGMSAHEASQGRWPWLELVASLRQLESSNSAYLYRDAVHGISRSLSKLPVPQGKAFLKRLYSDPALASPYLYYRLYHCENKPADIERLAGLADEIRRRHSAARLPDQVRVRLAEAYYQKRQLRKAAFWAGQSTDASDELVRARALYVRAASRYRQDRLESARHDLENLLATCPNSGLRHGARELLALVAEGQQDYPTALSQYLAIGYEEDAAYLIDVRMPTGSFARARREHPGKRALLDYSQALRYLRLEKWDSARACLARLSPVDYQTLLRTTSEFYEQDFPAQGADPRKTLARLEPLHRAVKTARSRKARAAAMYAYAREYYTAGTLQFYNAPLWKGRRMWDFSINWNPAVASKTDKAILQRYMYQHEVYAHTRRLCLDIARWYPETPTAPLALYRAACAAERLASLNSWWSGDNPAFDHTKEASKLMAQLVKRYPKHPLAPKAQKYAHVFVGEDFPEVGRPLTPQEAGP